jgi:Cu2+-exporting ATPase
MALEQGATLDTVVLDKTGTLTKGEPEVVAVATVDGHDEAEVLRLVASAEGDSEHPLAQAIIDAAVTRGLSTTAPSAFEAVPGHGLLATVDGRRLAVGNARLLDRERIAPDGLAATVAWYRERR